MLLKLSYILWAAVAGMFVASQSLINAHLAKFVGGGLWAAFYSFLVGTIILLVLNLAVSRSFKLPPFADIPSYAWLGGALGAFFVFTMIMLVTKLGVAAMISVVVAGQLVSALLLDHYGILASEPSPITWTRMLGVTFLIIGALLTQKF